MTCDAWSRSYDELNSGYEPPTRERSHEEDKLVIRELVSLMLLMSKHVPENKKKTLYDYLERKNLKPSVLR